MSIVDKRSERIYDGEGRRIGLPLIESSSPKNTFQDMEIILDGKLHFISSSGSCWRCGKNHSTLTHYAKQAGTYVSLT